MPHAEHSLWLAPSVHARLGLRNAGRGRPGSLGRPDVTRQRRVQDDSGKGGELPTKCQWTAVLAGLDRGMRIFLLLFLSVVSLAHSAEPRWWKGNLHTHTLWSDGDDYPEMVADWYKQHGYNFLALSDHNILSNQERWVSVAKSKGGDT